MRLFRGGGRGPADDWWMFSRSPELCAGPRPWSRPAHRARRGRVECAGLNPHHDFLGEPLGGRGPVGLVEWVRRPVFGWSGPRPWSRPARRAGFELDFVIAPIAAAFAARAAVPRPYPAGMAAVLAHVVHPDRTRFSRMERRRVALFRRRGLGAKPLGLPDFTNAFRTFLIVPRVPGITLRRPARAHPSDRGTHRAPLDTGSV